MTTNTSLLKRRALALWQDAQQYQRRGDIRRAIDLYTQSISVFPTAEAYTYRGWAYGALKRWEEAIAECKKAIEVDPSLGNPYNDIGSYLLQQGRIEEGIEWLEKAKCAPRYDARHYPYMNLGRAYVARGMLRRATREFEEALRLSPGEPTCRAFLEELGRTLH